MCRGHPKPRGKTPKGCYWDPQPGAAAGTWRKLGSNTIHDVKEAKRRQVRNANRARRELNRDLLAIYHEHIHTL